VICHGLLICLGSRILFAKTVTSQLTFIVRVMFRPVCCQGEQYTTFIRLFFDP